MTYIYTEETEMDQFSLKLRKSVQFENDNPAFQQDDGGGDGGGGGDGIGEHIRSVSDIPKPERQESTDNSQSTWDYFEETPVDNFKRNSPFLDHLCMVLLKMLVSAFLFVFVLGTTLVSRLSLLEMVQQLRLVNVILPLTQEQQSTCHNRSQTKIEPNNTMNGTNQVSSISNNSTSTANTPPVLQVYWIWSLFLVICFPYFTGIIKGLWKIVFKQTKSISISILLLYIVVETLHSMGLLMLIFIVLTSVDPIRGSMLIYGVGLVPCLLDLLPARNDNHTACCRAPWIYHYFRKVISLSIAGFIVFLLTIFYKTMENDDAYSNNDANSRNIYYIAPISLVLISIKYWSLFSEKIPIDGVKRVNTKVSVLVSMLKIGYTLLFIYVFYGTHSKNCGRVLFVSGTSNKAIGCGFYNVTLSFSDLGADPFIYASVNMLAGFFCFRFAKTACQLLAQRFAFAIPLVLTGPLSTLLVLFFISQGLPFLKMTPKEAPPLIHRYLKGFLICYYEEFTMERIMAIGFYISFLFVTRHVWNPKVERVAKGERLFTSSIYCGVLLDQSIMLSRRRDKKTKKKANREESMLGLKYSAQKMKMMKDDPLIYACATMWHETENEMIQLLKSIFRMDLDQATRTYMKDNLGYSDDYYEFEAHLFFDDAFTFDVFTKTYALNAYVKQLLKCVPESCKAIHSDLDIVLPRKISTPYGGRLEWDLPGGNKMVAHLKNKALIRHRKRWSQVMYMYYFLGYRIFSEGVSQSVKRTRSRNTFLLALDGDVDFEPSAVLLLVDRMRRNPKVGAACGRIHPIGTGPMVWYQKFEYAISHWLQKATEHMIGCVLCSPGCFSLFRGSALAADNVLKRYTTLPSEAKHHVQYDQGEDRWLCTLLLQQGYRVEYCAASDALTYCPETFNEFYKQRRRWAPSTMANIMDLLMDWRNVRCKNDSISAPYIFYQMCLMVTSILTPGTIFMLIVGALHSAFDVSLTESLVINLVPVIIIMLLCFVSKEDMQLQFASVMSLLYAILMMLVLVGLMREIGTYLFCSDTTVLFCFVGGIFVLAAIIHPKEIFCLMHGLLYFILIPSMSILLMFYALGNLQNVSWGTRESQTEQVAKANEELEIAKASAEVSGPIKRKKSTIDRFNNFFAARGNSSNAGQMESEYSFSCGNVFRCLCFPKESSQNKDNLLEPLLNKVDDLIQMRSSEFAEMMKTQQEEKLQEASVSIQDGDIREYNIEKIHEDKAEHISSTNGLVSESGAGPLIRETDEGPLQTNPIYGAEWMYDEELMGMKTDEIDEDEITFWNNLIDQYLYPVDKDVLREKKMQENLVVLRNNVCLFFCLVNALFVMVIFTIEFSLANSSATSINFLCPGSDQPQKDTNIITIVFMLVFGVTLFIQLVAMLFHRYETFMHILASVDIAPKMMSKMDTNNFWRELSGDHDPSETDSVYSGLTEGNGGDTKTMRRHLFKRKKKPRNLKEKMDKRFSTAYDKVERYSAVTTKSFTKTADHMSWMLLLQNPEIKANAEHHREEIRKRWKKIPEMLKQRKLGNIVDQVMKKNSQDLTRNQILLSVVEDLKTPSVTTLHEDQQDSRQTIEAQDPMLVSVTVHSEKPASLKIDNAEKKELDQQDSVDTHQRDFEAAVDQNGTTLTIVQEKEQKTASAFLKRNPDTLASVNKTDVETHSQEKTLKQCTDDMSEYQHIPDNERVIGFVIRERGASQSSSKDELSTAL